MNLKEKIVRENCQSIAKIQEVLMNDKCNLEQLIDWWNETESNQGDLMNELDYNNIDLSVDEFLKLAER